MAKKNNSNKYLRIYLANRDLILSLDDKTLAESIRMAVRYFDNFEIVDVDNMDIQDPYLKLVFTALKQGCDDSIKSYHDAVRNANKRWHPDEEDDSMRPIAPL